VPRRGLTLVAVSIALTAALTAGAESYPTPVRYEATPRSQAHAGCKIRIASPTQIGRIRIEYETP